GIIDACKGSSAARGGQESRGHEESNERRQEPWPRFAELQRYPTWRNAVALEVSFERQESGCSVPATLRSPYRGFTRLLRLDQAADDFHRTGLVHRIDVRLLGVAAGPDARRPKPP